MADGLIPEPRKLAAGEFSAWLRSLREGSARGDLPEPAFIHVAPHEVEAIACIPKPLLSAAPGRPKGYVLMGYDENGECPMWTGDQCSIDERRPQTCRDHGCRDFAG